MTPYRPSSGTEGGDFCDAWCKRCKRDTAQLSCDILMRALAYPIDAPQYPKEWVRDASGAALCTAFSDRQRDS